MDKDNGLKTTYSALSFQFLLAEIIFWAVQEVAKKITEPFDIAGFRLTPKAVPSRNLKEDTLITYQTAIALNLSHQWNKPVHDVAEDIALQMRRITGGCSTLEAWPLSALTVAIGRTLTMSIHPQGYIQCHLSAATIDMWLQAMRHVNTGRFHLRKFPDRGHGSPDSHPLYPGTLPEKLPSTSNQLSSLQRSTSQSASQWAISDIPFTIFHAHARCCSLLRLAHTTHQITLQPWLVVDPDIDPDILQDIGPSMSLGMGPLGDSSMHAALRPPWTLSQPQSLPWQMILSPQGCPQEWAIAHPLLTQLVTSLDQFATLTAKFSHPFQNHSQTSSRSSHDTKLLKELVALSNAIHRFDADVIFFGDKNGRKDACPVGTAQQTSACTPYLGLLFIAQGLLNERLAAFLTHANICLDIPNEL